VAEGAPGGSSTLPHKRNPVAAVSAIACAAQAPGLVATLLAAAASPEHERAAGAWHAEWRPLSELLRSTGSAAAWLRASLCDLRVDTGRMRANLDVTGGLLLAERVTGTLAPARGRLAARGAPPADGLLDPAGYLGSAGEFVDRALRDHGVRREETWPTRSTTPTAVRREVLGDEHLDRAVATATPCASPRSSPSTYAPPCATA